MIKSKLSTVFIPVKGGLGNQMFFYAFSLFLKSKNVKSKLVWDEYIYTKQHNGVELLEVFDIHVDSSSRNRINFFIALNKAKIPFIFKRILGRLHKSKYLFITKYKQSSPYSFDNVLSEINTESIYFDGFWQNHKYLKDIRLTILEHYKFKLPDEFENDFYLKKILNSNSVSIHIRRGDYLDPKFAELNVIQNNDYYNRAIEYIKTQCVNPIFFIFTDDLKWAKENFVSNDFIFVEGNINHLAYLDIYLMNQCKHNIIANSTFSWWGAWLNINDSKIVIAPSKWTTQVLSSQFCPPDWIFLEI